VNDLSQNSLLILNLKPQITIAILQKVASNSILTNSARRTQISLTSDGSFSLKKRIQLLFVLLGCLHLIAGPYALVQVFAWTTMLIDYSKETGIIQGAKDTFSGEKPCRLCCKIKAAEKQEKRSPFQLPAERLIKLTEGLIRSGDVTAPSPTFAVAPTVGFMDAVLSAGIGPNAPPVPPPC
jgi:hypothetical protein